MNLSVGPYRLDAKIADGGMAEVYLGSKLGADGWQKQVVIKRILPYYSDLAEFRQLFLNEAALTTKLTHPNLVHIYDYLAIDPDLFLVQEYLDGKDLRAIAARARGNLPWQVVTYVGYEILKALHYLHSHQEKILHHDISPQNVIITFDGQVKLIDLGIAKHATKHEPTREFRGKKHYMPPEYLTERKYTTLSEIYAVGKVLRELLTQSANVPEDLMAILKQATDDNPAQRFSDGLMMRQALAQVLRKHQVSTDEAEMLTRTVIQEFFPNPEDRTHYPLEQTAVMKAADHEHLVLARFGQITLATVVALAIIFWPNRTSLNEREAAVSIAALNPLLKYAKPNGGSTGRLEVDSYPWTSVYLNGRFLGVTPLTRVEVPRGDYQLYLVTRDGRSVEMPVNIEAGATRKLFQKIP